MRIFMFNFSKHKLKDEEEASTFHCGICFETMLATSTNKFENNDRCPCSFCNDCIAKHIKVSIEQCNRGKIRCPGSPACGQLLDPLSCRHIIPAPLFIKWCEMLCNLALLELDTCYCPYRDCSALVIVTECGVGDLVRRSKCPHCKRLFCFQCKQPWHAGYGCEDSSSDLEFGVVEKTKKWMRCPVCKHCVERAKGCSFIRCRCETSFCYKCGMKWDYNHVCSKDKYRCHPRLIEAICCILFFVFTFLLLLQKLKLVPDGWLIFSSRLDIY